MTTTNTSSSSSSTTGMKLNVGQCPYAVALSEDEASQHQQSPTSTKKLTAATLSQCPAFAASASGSKCPFKEAKSPEEVQQTLAQIPKSHYAEHQFVEVIQHLHKVHEQGGDSGFAANLPTLQACPMKPYVKEENRKGFREAMEDFSLAAIMARLAADMEDNSEYSGVGIRRVNSEVSLFNMVENDDEEEAEEAANESSVKDTYDKLDDEDSTQSNRESNNCLAEALKAGTAVSHQAAEDVHFVKNFIKGQIDRHLYQEMILGLYHVYLALEEALDQHAPTVFSSCHFPEELSRKESLEEDCEFWHNTRNPSPRTISPATQDYMDRIQYLAHHDPLLLLAHSYTRYLGDLSGGRILARVARRALALDKESGEGLAFYRFEKVKSYKQFKDNYRQSLDDLPLTDDEVQALVAEANVAFCLNMRLFQELDVEACIPGARVMSMEEVMEYAHKCTNTLDNAAAEDQCPFLVNKKKEQQQQEGTGEVVKQGGRCPWPFIFAHDPWQGMRDWQTWLVVALVVAWLRVF